MAGRAFKMFGLSPDENVASTLKAVFQRYATQSGSPERCSDADALAIPLETFCNFWESLGASKDAATRGFREIIDQLQKMRKNAKSIAKRDVDIMDASRGLINCMFFLSLFFPHDYRKLKRPFDLWIKSNNKDTDLVKADAGIAQAQRFITLPPDEKPLIEIVVTVASPSVVPAVEWRFPPLSVAQEPRRLLRSPSDFPFLWPYIVGVATDGTGMDLILQALVSILRRVPEHLKVLNTPRARSGVLLLLLVVVVVVVAVVVVVGVSPFPLVCLLCTIASPCATLRCPRSCQAC